MKRTDYIDTTHTESLIAPFVIPGATEDKTKEIALRDESEKQYIPPIFSNVRRGRDAFGLAEHRNTDEVIYRRIIDEMEGLVKFLAGKDKTAAKEYKKVLQQKTGSIILPHIVVSDAFSYQIEAKYSSEGERQYSVTRSDEYSTGDEGFRLIRNRDGSVCIKEIEINDDTNNSPEHQKALFESAQNWIHDLSNITGMSPDALLDHGRKGEVKRPRNQIRKKLGSYVTKRTTKIKQSTTEVKKALLKPSSAKKIGIITLVSVGLQSHALFSNEDAKIGPIPMPLPIELLVDINNAPDHTATSFERPEEGAVIRVGESATIPLYGDYDTSNAPSTLFKPNGGPGKYHVLKDGLWVLMTREFNPEGGCEQIEGDFGGKELVIFSTDTRIEKVPAKAELVNDRLLQICKIANPAEVLNSKVPIYIYQSDIVDEASSVKD